jgi:RNA polymerase sigma-70 factor (ECF subfamily)
MDGGAVAALPWRRAMSASYAASMPAPDGDEALVAAFVGGDRAAFERLVQRHSHGVYNFIYRMVGNRADAEDIAQDVFVQVFRSLPKTRTDLPFRPWLYVVARNKCLDFLKRKRPLLFADTAGPDDEGDDLAARVPDTEPLPDELVERADLQRVLQEAIEALPPKYRQVVALRYGAELGFAEIGETLALPENTVKTHFHRAKALLRARLSNIV